MSQAEEEVAVAEREGVGAVTAETAERRQGGRRDTDRAKALTALSTTLAESIGDSDAVLDAVVRLVSEFLGDTAVIRLLDDDGIHIRPVAAYDRDPSLRDLVWSLVTMSPTRVDRLDLYQQAVSDAEPVLISGAELQASLELFPADGRAKAEALDLRACLICPLRARGTVIGTLALWRHGERTSHSERDRNFCQELADRAALAIENSRLVARLRAELEERVRAEEGLRLTAELLQRADEKRRALIENLVSAQEEERRRIALDVHDDSIQAMAAVGLRLQALRRRSDNPDIIERVQAIEEAVAESIVRLRGLLFQLDSASLEKVGLVRALTQYMHQVFPDGDPRSRVKNLLDVEPVGHVRVVLYRIAQEALINIRKHARAREVNVTLKDVDEGYMVTIHDDGAGFDPEVAVARSLPGHLGLRSMRERSELANGWFDVESGPDAGTLVRFWVPSSERSPQRAKPGRD